MLRSLLSGLLLATLFSQASAKLNISFGGQYSSFLLYQDEEGSRNTWGMGGEIEISNYIPNLGLKLRGSKTSYDIPGEEVNYVYEYIPLTLCTSFDILPFLHLEWFDLSMETGFGLYLWKGLENGEVIVLDAGKKMDETDFGFVGGLTVQFKPVRYLGIEFSTRYNYIASSDINKYGFYDKDEKLWENGIGIKFLIQ